MPVPLAWDWRRERNCISTFSFWELHYQPYLFKLLWKTGEDDG